MNAYLVDQLARARADALIGDAESARRARRARRVARQAVAHRDVTGSAGHSRRARKAAVA